MTHDELANDLARHLFGDGTERMVWTNMQMGPAGSPRPDVMAIDKSFSKFRVNTYEVKVSVADLRRDLTAGKWQTYLPFSHAVWFAMPRGLARPAASSCAATAVGVRPVDRCCSRSPTCRAMPG